MPLLSSSKKCPQCNTSLSEYDELCPKCGTYVGAAPQTSVQIPAERNEYQETIAGLTGLTYYPGKGPFNSNEGAVMGAKNGYLVAIGPNKVEVEDKSGLSVVVRFLSTDQPDNIRRAVQFPPELLSALGIKELTDKYRSEIEVAKDHMHWMWPQGLKKPKAEFVAELLGSFLKAAKEAAPPFDGLCESCRINKVDRITLFYGMPGYYCASCQQKIHHEIGTAAREYESIELNLVRGFLYGLAGSVVGGILWGLLAYWSERIFAVAAIGIGFLVAWLVHKGAGKITTGGQVLVGVLTILSVLLGDALFFTLVAIKELDAPFSFELLLEILLNFIDIETQSGNFASFLFAVVGAFYAIRRFQKPTFKVDFEPLPGSAAS